MNWLQFYDLHMFVVIFLNYQNLTIFFLKWIFSYLCMWRVNTICSANVFDKVFLAPQTSDWLSLLNKVPRVPQVPKCPSAFRVPEYPSALSALRVPECPQCPSAQVPWVPEFPSALQVPWVPQVFECLKSPSASVSQLVSQSVIQLFYKADSVSEHLF